MNLGSPRLGVSLVLLMGTFGGEVLWFLLLVTLVQEESDALWSASSLVRLGWWVWVGSEVGGWRLVGGGGSEDGGWRLVGGGEAIGKKKEIVLGVGVSVPI